MNGSILVGLAIAGTIGAVAYPVFYSYPHRNDAATAAAVTGDTVNTQWGPLTAADRDLIVRVRLAGLWELPAGQQAMEKSASAAVKEAANHLIVGHNDLDRRVRSISAQLNVPLPNQPNAQQQGWLNEMSAAQGTEYDKVWANLLRSAHGKIFPAIATVRNTTRNTLVRQLASDANQTVLDHITILEKTGQVDFEEIAESAAGPSASPTGPPPPSPGVLAPAAPEVVPTGDTDLKSTPSPTTPGTVNTNRPEAPDPNTVTQTQ
jgi:putative membrane protein